MLDVREVRVAAERTLAGQVKHLRAQRGKHTPLTRQRRRGGVEHIEKRDRRVPRTGVVARRLRVTRTDPDQRAVAVVTLERGRLGGNHRRIALPQVDDPGGGDERLGRDQQWT